MMFIRESNIYALQNMQYMHKWPVVNDRYVRYVTNKNQELVYYLY